MSEAKVRLLFIPVSGPKGMGEYGRALAMAGAAASRWPKATIHFAVSRQAPYANSVPFPATLMPASPTFHSAEVAALIREFRPSVVIFDNSGRTAQLRAASASGARVVFVSARSARRRKAFRLRWMRLIDEHWIAYPSFIARPPGSLERAKLRLLGRPVLRFLNPVLPDPDEKTAQAVLAQLGVRAGEYIAMVPGGGTEHPGMARSMEGIAQAAHRIANRGIDTVLVGMNESVQVSGLRQVPRLPVQEFSELLRNARLVVANGGYTLLQALACDKACIAVPLARDQAQRIARCVSAGIAVRGHAENSALERDVLEIIEDNARLEGLRAARASFDLGNGARTVVDALGALSGA